MIGENGLLEEFLQERMEALRMMKEIVQKLPINPSEMTELVSDLKSYFQFIIDRDLAEKQKIEVYGLMEVYRIVETRMKQAGAFGKR